jgi:hypothetical protein
MSRCHFCGWLNDHHDYCPIFHISGDKKLWDKGFLDGQSGVRAQSDDPSYRLGYERGLESREA